MSLRPRIARSSWNSMSSGVAASPSTVACDMSSPYGVPFVRPSMRAAVFVMSPMTVYSSRRSEPTLPEMTSPVLRPTPMRNGSWPLSSVWL